MSPIATIRSYRPVCLTRAIFLVLLLAFLTSFSLGADVVFWHVANEDQQELAALKVAAQFYGLHLVDVRLNSAGELVTELHRIRHSDTFAVVASAAAMQNLSNIHVLQQNLHVGRRRLPLLIVGITTRETPTHLRLWSDGALSSCLGSPELSAGATYVVGPHNEVTGELAGRELPALLLPACNLENKDGHDVDSLLSLRTQDHLRSAFVRTHTNSTEVFLLPELKQAGKAKGSYQQGIGDAFSAVAPFMLFVRYAAGEYGWHSPGAYANLTIDDPWLIEPYGFLNYEKLLHEMDKHNFHTTIAFIPWNFDRSHTSIASIFTSRPDRFSVAIHGNNHDHREFDQLSSASAGVQEQNIKQALGRMGCFSALTGISYDAVMVFPHGIAPAATLGILKPYNFLATINSQDVPLGSATPAEPDFPLRPFTIKYGQFPSIMRWSAEIPVPELTLAVNAFLGNPILLYGHHELFRTGSDAFNPVADTVNRLVPGVHWCSLGCIARHLYLLRLDKESQAEVMMLGPSISIKNSYRHDVEFVIHKQENDLADIQSVTVGGQKYPFTNKGDSLVLTVTLPAGASRQIDVLYRNNLHLVAEDCSKDGIRVALLRRTSDFRDLTLSRWSIGSFLTRLYYAKRLDDVEISMERAWPLVLLAAVCIVGVTVIRRRKRSGVGAADPSGAAGARRP